METARRKLRPRRYGSWARMRRLHLDQAARAGRWFAPRVINAGRFDHRPRLIEALGRLRQCVYVDRKPLVLDFSRTTRMFAEGTLLLVAELRRLIRLTNGEVQITCDIPKSNKIAQVLKQVGIFELLGVACDVECVDADVVSWRYAHGHRVDGDKYENVLGEYDGQIAEALTTQLYKGITEAMTNVVNHAYISPRNDGLPPQSNPEWWMFSRQSDGYLAIVFCDLGAGIPATLPAKRPSLWRRIQSMVESGDADVISYAIEDSISRTRASHRGKGLGQIVRTLESIPGSEIAIYSNLGHWRRRNGKTKLNSFSDSIMGTMILWKIPLQSEAV